MLRAKKIDRVCCAVLALTLLLAAGFTALAAAGKLESSRASAQTYENHLFSQDTVHRIDIQMDDWDAFIAACTDEEYRACTVQIDGESQGAVGIRAKGNTSLSSVAQYDNDRYSFKVEFDHYQTGKTYRGLDKLSLNNLIQDATYMKDYWCYTFMGRMGVAAPLCSYTEVYVNGEYWGFYLAVEGVEDAFLERAYGTDSGNLYKPDSMSFGGGRGNGRDFDMQQLQQENDDGADGQSPADSAASAAVPPLSEGMRFPGGMTAPDDASADAADRPTPPQMPGGDENGFDPASAFGKGGQGGFGGFGGIGSSDVKLQYIDDDPDSYPNIFDNAKTKTSEKDKARLIAALKKLGEGDLSSVDTDAVAMYMAVHNFVCNGDSYTGSMVHNYYLYEKNGVLSMIPWDYNLAFGGFSGGDATSAVNTPIDTLVSGGTDGDRPMADWITASEDSLALYHEKYAQFIQDVFESGWFAEEFDRVTALIAPYVEKDENGFYSYAEFQAGAETLKQFCLLRAQSVQGQLSGEIPATQSAQTGADSLIDASAITLTAMGGMNNGRGGENGGMGGHFGGNGGFGRSMGQRTGGAASPDQSGDESTSFAPATGDFTPPTQTDAENASFTPPSGDFTPPTQTSEEKASFTPFTGDFPQPGQQNATDANSNAWLWLGASALLLLAALVFARCLKKPT